MTKLDIIFFHNHKQKVINSMSNKSKKSKKKIYLFSGIGAVVLILVLVVVFGGNKEKIISVQTEKIQRKTITQKVAASGKIQPETMVKINAEVSGEITELPVKEGEKVKRGDLLVRIKADQYLAQVERSNAALSSAKANLTLQSATLEKVQSEFSRANEMYQKKLISEQEFITAKTNSSVAQAQYESARAGVAQAEASLKDAKESLAKTTIYAPMDGTISALKSELGERVSGSSFTQGTEIMTVADLAKMEARVNVGENDIVLISVGDTARITVDAYQEKKLKGIVYEIANTATTKGLGTQEEVTNFEVKIRVLDKNITLLPGMSMTADIETETRANVLAVPIQSVTIRASKDEKKEESSNKNSEEKSNNKKKSDKPTEVVFLNDNGKAKMISVERGISDDEYVEITKGLEEGKEVVSGGYKAISRELEDGTVLKIDNEEKKFGMKKGKE